MPPEPLRLLFVDDDPTQVELVARALRSDGFEVSSVISPVGVSAIVQTFAPDVVLLDVNIPALSGDRLLSLARQGAPPHTLFVFFSSSDPASLRKLAAEAGADGWLSKTSSASEIGAALRTLCANRPPKKS